MMILVTGKAGFTLFEVLLILFILGLIFLIRWPLVILTSEKYLVNQLERSRIQAIQNKERVSAIGSIVFEDDGTSKDHEVIIGETKIKFEKSGKFTIQE